jgi:hypothetical protein
LPIYLHDLAKHGERFVRYDRDEGTATTAPSPLDEQVRGTGVLVGAKLIGYFCLGDALIFKDGEFEINLLDSSVEIQFSTFLFKRHFVVKRGQTLYKKSYWFLGTKEDDSALEDVYEYVHMMLSKPDDRRAIFDKNCRA